MGDFDYSYFEGWSALLIERRAIYMEALINTNIAGRQELAI